MNEIVTGKVIRGKREGSKIGFPTANINVAESVEPGIYVGFTQIPSLYPDKKLNSLFYIPEDDTRRVESHILDFPNTDLYGSEISVEIIHKLRGVLNFSDLEEAQEQIKKDELKAREWFGKR